MPSHKEEEMDDYGLIGRLGSSTLGINIKTKKFHRVGQEICTFEKITFLNFSDFEYFFSNGIFSDQHDEYF